MVVVVVAEHAGGGLALTSEYSSTRVNLLQGNLHSVATRRSHLSLDNLKRLSEGGNLAEQTTTPGRDC